MTTYRATILGTIWQPGSGLCSTERTFQAESDQAAVDKAYITEAGDFSSVRDVFVTTGLDCYPPSTSAGQDDVEHHHNCERLVKDWDTEENENLYLDTVRAAV